MNTARDFEQRIAEALTRIRQRLEWERLERRVQEASGQAGDFTLTTAVLAAEAGALPAATAPVDPADEGIARARIGELKTELAAVKAELAAAKAENVALFAESEAKLAAMVLERDAARQRLADLEGALEAMRTSQTELAEVTAELREHLAAEVYDPELVNRALQAELESVQALRAADAAEVAALVAELRPLVEERG